MTASCLLIGQITADRRVMKTSTHQPTRYRIYADSSQPIPDAFLSNANYRLASTADSKFESVLIGRIKADCLRKFPHTPTACSRPTELAPSSR